MSETKNATTIAADPTVEINPLSAINAGVQAARGVTGLRTEQFNLQQSQLQPAYQSMRMLMATNPNPSWDDVNAALAQSTRIGGNVSGLVANAAEIAGKGGKPADFMRATGLGGMSAETQGTYVYPQRMSVNTGSNLVYGTTPGLATPNAGQFNPAGDIQLGLTPSERTDIQQVGVNPDGSPIMKPRGVTYGQPLGGGGTGGGGGGGGGGGPLLPPGASADVAAARIDQIGQRESGNQNIPNRQGPGGAPLSTASGPYQFLDSTWQQAAREYGIPNPTQRAMQTDPAIQREVAIKFLQNHGEQAWAASAPGGAGGGGGGGGHPASGPFIGATSVQPVGGAGGPANVRSAGGGMQHFGPTGQPTGPGGAAAYQGYTGLPLGAEDIAGGNIKRQQALEAQMNAAVSTRATLEGMEAELAKMPPSGVAAGALATIKNLLVQAGGLSQKELDRQAQGLAAQEQFEKFSAMLNQQLLAGMGGQATDARQELTGAATPSSVHSTLGNMGIIHMLEGNLIATQVMGREFQNAVRAGKASPQQFDQWRDDFTKPGPNGARFDPRVLWLSQMGPQEQQSYVNSLTAKDKTQLLKNANFAEQKGWVYENPDHSMGTGY